MAFCDHVAYRRRSEVSRVQLEGTRTARRRSCQTTPASRSFSSFYPKDDTPGCTKETCAFRDNLPKFKTSKAAVLGVSILDEKSKARFAKKFDVNFPLLADADHEVAEKYGVWQKKSLYGREFMGIARTTYLIGTDGKVAKRWDNVKVDGHAESVLAAVKAL